MRSPPLLWRRDIMAQGRRAAPEPADFSRPLDEAAPRATFARSLIDFLHGQEKSGT